MFQPATATDFPIDVTSTRSFTSKLGMVATALIALDTETVPTARGAEKITINHPEDTVYLVIVMNWVSALFYFISFVESRS